MNLCPKASFYNSRVRGDCLKKYTYLIFFVLLATLIVAGCSGSSNDTAPYTQNNSSQIKASPQNSTNNVTYQDAEWVNNVENNRDLINADLNNSTHAIIISDYKTLATSGQNLINDSQNALNQSNQFSVSPVYKNAQKEWKLSLENVSNVGKYAILVANDGENESVTQTVMNEDIKKMGFYYNSAVFHSQRARICIKSAQKNS